MNRFAHVAALLLFAALLAGWTAAVNPVEFSQDGDEAPPPEQGPTKESSDPTTNETDEQRKVVVFVSRQERVSGTVERDEPDVIVIRNADGVHSFVKSRIAKIVDLVTPKPGQQAWVILNDGTTREGLLLQDGLDEVIIEVKGVRTRYPRELVDHVELIPTFEERYAELKRTIQKEDQPRRIQLCEWLLDQHHYDLAEKELVELNADHPGLSEVHALLRIVRARRVLEDPQSKTDVNVDESIFVRDDPNRGPVDQRDLLPRTFITHEDVNLIRVYEIDFDNPPTVNVSPDTIRALLTEYASHASIPANSAARNRIFQWDSVDVVRLMFEVRARDLYPQIEVVTEPYSLNLFRQRVHNAWLIQNCATSRCHGGLDAGRLFLHSRNYRDERVRYTNLLILLRTELDPERPLINFKKPLDSLLIQAALPVTEARYPHPEVRGWKPVFTRGNTKLLEDTVEWIRSMNADFTDYPVTYEPPSLIHEEQKAGDSTERVDR